MNRIYKKLIIILSIILILINLIVFFQNVTKYTVLPGVDVILHNYYTEEILNNGNYNHDYPLGFHTLTATYSSIIQQDIQLSMVILVFIFLIMSIILLYRIANNKIVVIIFIAMSFIYNNLINGSYSHIISIFFILLLFRLFENKNLKNPLTILLITTVGYYHPLTLFFIFPLFIYYLSKNNPPENKIKFTYYFIITQMIILPFFIHQKKLHILLWIIIEIIYLASFFISPKIYSRFFLLFEKKIIRAIITILSILGIYIFRSLPVWSGTTFYIIFISLATCTLIFSEITPKKLAWFTYLISCYICFGFFDLLTFKSISNLSLYFLLPLAYLLVFDSSIEEIKLRYKKIIPWMIFFLLITTSIITSYRIIDIKERIPVGVDSYAISLYRGSSGFGIFLTEKAKEELINYNFSTGSRIENLGGLYTSWFFLYNLKITNVNHYDYFNNQSIYGDSRDFFYCNKNISRELEGVIISKKINFPIESPWTEIGFDGTELEIYKIINTSQDYACLNYTAPINISYEDPFYNYNLWTVYNLSAPLIIKNGESFKKLKFAITGTGNIKISCKDVLILFDSIEKQERYEINVNQCDQIEINKSTGELFITSGYLTN